MKADSSTDTLINLALYEDLGERGDITSEWFIDPNHRSIGKILSREDAVVSGVKIMDRVFRKIDHELKLKTICLDGSEVRSGDVIYEIEGKTQSILTGERIALNFLQRLSGCATVTMQFRGLVAHTKVKLLDTRKTTPGWRLLEKEAVIHGGGVNHRMGLYDAVMVKDNHLVAIGGVESLARKIAQITKNYARMPVIIEADLLSQVEAILQVPGVDRILLDNMNLRDLRKSVQLRDQTNPKIQLEASGGVNLKTVKSIAETGVDYISIGALTHSIRVIDFGLDLVDL